MTGSGAQSNFQLWWLEPLTRVLRQVDRRLEAKRVVQAPVACRICGRCGPTRAHIHKPRLNRDRVPAGSGRRLTELTEREIEVLTLIAQGLTNQQIADRLFVSVKTVRNHVSNVFSKLQVADRAQAALRARDAGLGSSQS